MRPDAETTNAFKYCLAVAAQRTKVEVIFFVAMSNHYHAGIIDVAGRLPEFLEHFHKLFAKHQNVLRGRWENFWAPEQTSAVELVDDQDVIAKLTYALTNPVKAHLVTTAAAWPGASSLSAHLHDEEISAVRPRRFFRPDGPMPARVLLELVRPPGLEEMSNDEYGRLIAERVAQAEAAVAAERLKERTRVPGPKAVRRQHWADRPATIEPRRNLSPRVACKNTWRRIEVLQRNKAFIRAYQSARALFLQGVTIAFPQGTYWLCRFARQSCDPPPAVPALCQAA